MAQAYARALATGRDRSNSPQAGNSSGSQEVRDVALRRPGECSTMKSEERAARNAFDGDPKTRWTSTYEDDQWLSVDLGQEHSLVRVSIRWEVAHASRYMLQSSPDGKQWTTMANETGREGWVATPLPAGSSGRWVRMFGQKRATSFGFSIWDMKVFAPVPKAVMPAAVPAAPQGFKSQGPDAHYEVVHDRVVVRASPSTKAGMLSVMQRGDKVFGAPYTVDGNPWLRLDESAVEDNKIPVKQTGDGAWLLIDGKSVGLGELLRKLPGTYRPPPRTAKPATLAKSREPKEPAEPVQVHATPFGAPAEFLVVNDKVVERRQPSVDASAVKIHTLGEMLLGTPHFVQETATPWLRLDREAGDPGWMLMDGASMGLGQLLQPARDIAEDLVRWARQYRKTPKGQQVAWTETTEEELRGLERFARAQVDVIRPVCDHQRILAELEKVGFIGKSDFTLGIDGVATQILRALLRGRAGKLVLGEPGADGGDLPWQEDAFPVFVDKILLLAPFHCRVLVPEDQPPQRLLILFHGSYVRGDDLVSEAETLRGMMPDVAVVLPEAPTVANQEYQLRVWWSPKQGAAQPAGIRESRQLGLLAPPQGSVERVALTVEWAAKRFKGLPLIIGGFSQGAMLAAQSLKALSQNVLGFVVLSGLAVSFEVARATTKLLAIHGDADDRIQVDVAREIADEPGMKKTGLSLEVFPGLGHSISDLVLDRIVRFCDDVAPVERALVRKDDSMWMQDVNQAKVVRWVKNVSKVITMFDDDRFMSHIACLNMKGLGDDSPSLGNGLVRYRMRDVPDRRGVVILFHGKVLDLMADTYYYAEAYKKLRMSTCIIDFRQKFSQFTVDATIVLDELETITGDTKTPVFVHGIGMGGIHALHMAIASHAYSAVLRRRLRLLVLDGSVSNFKALPPSPTGCIATDPIGNDEKLQYIGMPLCLVGGDDACCGAKWTGGHWVNLLRSSEGLLEDRKIPALTTHQGTMLMEGVGDARFCPEVFQGLTDAIDRVQGAKGEATSKFLDDVLGNCKSEEDMMIGRKFGDAELMEICGAMLKAARSQETVSQLWDLLRAPAADRGEAHYKLVVSAHMPVLRKCGKFSKGHEGFREFEAVVAAKAELHDGLAKAHAELHDAFDLQKIELQIRDLEKDRASSHGIRWDKLHRAFDWALEEWGSPELWMKAVNDVKGVAEIKLGTASSVVKEISGEMNSKCAAKLGLQGGAWEVGLKLDSVMKHYGAKDPTLPAKLLKLQEATGNFAKKLSEHLRFLKDWSKSEAVEDTKPAESTSYVNLVVEHAMDGNSIIVFVPSTARALDVRKVIAAQLDEADVGQVSLVVRVGKSGFRELPDDQPIGDCGTVLMMGRSLPGKAGAGPPPEEEGAGEELELTIHIDRALGLSSTMALARGSAIRAIKEQLAAADPTGTTRAEDFGLRLPGSDALLNDGDPIIPAMVELEVCLPDA